jgi:DNA-binding PadR family transcriptional regulator
MTSLRLENKKEAPAALRRPRRRRLTDIYRLDIFHLDAWPARRPRLRLAAEGRVEPSVADFVILGFLYRSPMSGYDVRRRMAATTAHFYRTSFGSIYPSLARMEAEGLVASARSDAAGRARKVFRILSAGRKAFREWLASPIDIAAGPSLLLARIFFLGSIDPEQARSVLASFAKSAAERRAWLEGAIEGAVRELGDGCGPPDSFQASTRGFGLEYYAFVEEWLGRLGAEAARGSGKADDRPSGGRRERS